MTKWLDRKIRARHTGLHSLQPPLYIEYSYYISSSCLINYLPSHAFITGYRNSETTSNNIFGLQVLEFDPWSWAFPWQVDIPRPFASVFPEAKEKAKERYGGPFLQSRAGCKVPSVCTGRDLFKAPNPRSWLWH